jgi:hypothetical protein
VTLFEKMTLQQALAGGERPDHDSALPKQLSLQGF